MQCVWVCRDLTVREWKLILYVHAATFPDSIFQSFCQNVMLQRKDFCYNIKFILLCRVLIFGHKVILEND